MDIITQGLLGATLAQAASKQSNTRLATAVGFLAAILADADFLIRSANDPLLNIEFHRHFSHSLIFIPIGGLLAAVILWPFLRKHLGFGQILFFTLLGYATSGLLDACTSYGTQLLWPFSDERIAWRIIAIVDPVFSLILIIAIIVAIRKRKPLASQIGLALAAAYLMLGFWQHQNALDAATQLADKRGHQVDRMMVKPTMANLILWRSVYESEGTFYVDGIRVGLWSEAMIYTGGQAKRYLPTLTPHPALQHDIERFLYFSEDYVIADSTRENVLVDLRYSMLPNGLSPLWGIDLNVNSPGQHAQFVNFRDRSSDTRQRFIEMLLGRN
ncbi:MAG: metal-dependent hydrolase [Gammaproteobacteria bacterium]|nr:metal-dependent hydrolase [Gammaproteobacteria bacterium]